jgi:methionyl-tRNA formyltransferase
MALRVVFFGNSESVFSNRHFHALVETPCQVVGVVDVPPAKRTSTNTRPVGGVSTFVELARRGQAEPQAGHPPWPAGQPAPPADRRERRPGDGPGAPVPVFEPASPNRPEFVQAMRELTPDLFVAVGYMNLLKEDILSVPRMLVANFHASLLPAYRGKHPVFWALRNGEPWCGLTVHLMDADFDTGDILYQVRVRTRKHDTVASLYDRIMERSLGLVPRLVHDAGRGRVPRTPQPELGASYYSSVSLDDFRLDWSRDAEQLRRWIQTSPGQCFHEIGGQRVFFMDADMVTLAASSEFPAGALMCIGRTTCTVATGQDALRLGRVRREQPGEQSMPQLCRELGLQPGDALL